MHMSLKRFATRFAIAGCAVALSSGALAWMFAQQAPNFFTAVDANKDGFITRDELKSVMAKWLSDGDRDHTGSITEEQLATVLDAVFPESAFLSTYNASGPQNQTPKAEDVEKMLAALPASAPAKPKQPRKVLVLSKCAGFVHSCIPLAAKTVEALGSRTGAWTTTVTYDPAFITAENLKQYDLLFLNNTTGAFLDDPNDPAATASRKKALLEFVRSGKRPRGDSRRGRFIPPGNGRSCLGPDAGARNPVGGGQERGQETDG